MGRQGPISCCMDGSCLGVFLGRLAASSGVQGHANMTHLLVSAWHGGCNGCKHDACQPSSLSVCHSGARDRSRGGVPPAASEGRIQHVESPCGTHDDTVSGVIPASALSVPCAVQIPASLSSPAPVGVCRRGPSCSWGSIWRLPCSGRPMPPRRVAHGGCRRLVAVGVVVVVVTLLAGRRRFVVV